MAETTTYRELLQQAREAEAQQDAKLAIKNYLAALKKMPSSQPVYSRLMTVYRKQKAYGKELAIINKALGHFGKIHGTVRPGKKITPKLSRLSKMLSKSLGLVDQKGNALHTPEPLAKWIRRKNIVLKKMKD